MNPDAAHASRIRRARPFLIAALVLILVLNLGWLWIWPNRGIGAFTTRLADKQQLVTATLDHVLGQTGNDGLDSIKPDDLDEARRAYRLDRSRVGDLLCLDGCPAWNPGDPIVATRTDVVPGNPKPCRYWLKHVHPRGIKLAVAPHDGFGFAGDCRFRGVTADGITIKLTVSPDSDGLTVAWSAETR